MTTTMVVHYTLRAKIQALSLVSWSIKISKISENFMVLNPDKYHSLIAGFQNAQPNFFYDNIAIKNVSEEKILLIVNDLFVVSYN